GVGILIQKELDTGFFRIVAIVAGGPAERAGVLTEDRITRIMRRMDSDGRPLARPEVTEAGSCTPDEAVAKLRGKEGTAVTLTVRGKGEDNPVEIEITRATLEDEAVVGFNRKHDGAWEYYADPAGRVGYVRISRFAASTARDLRAALDRLRDEDAHACV